MPTTDDTEAIKSLLDTLAAALRRKDAAAAVAVYAKDAVNYDLAPPLSIESQPLRDPAYIQQWFDTWSSPIESTPRSLTIRVAGDIGFAFGLRHMTGTKKDGQKVDLWFRATACFVRNSDGWKVLHMHNSVPFAMDGSDRALLDLKP